MLRVEQMGDNLLGGNYYLCRSGKPILYNVTTAAPPNPMLCCKASLAPGTCLFSASPRNCQQSSAHWARPVGRMHRNGEDYGLRLWLFFPNG